MTTTMAQHPGDWMATHADPYEAFFQWREANGYLHSTYIGMTANGVEMTAGRGHTIFVGPTQGTGKTAGGMIPNAIAAPSTAVVVSVKPDIFNETALICSRRGEIMHLALDGDHAPGAVPIRIDLLKGCENADIARATAANLIQVASMVEGHSANRSDVGQHFDALAGSALACLFFYARSVGHGMRWVMDTITAQRASPNDEADKTDDRVFSVLWQRLGAIDERMARVWEGIIYLDSRERGSVFSTLNVALTAFQSSTVLDAMENPNFDPDALVAKEYGRGARVYITSGTESQRQFAPVISVFLTLIRRATYARHRALSAYGRTDDIPPVTIINDELFNTPWADLISALSEAAGQGLNLVGGIQSLSLAKAKWGDAIGADFLGLWTTVVVLPGIRDTSTLEAISSLSGEVDRKQYTRNFDPNPDKETGRKEPTTSEGWHTTRRLTAAEISAGHPMSKDIGLVLHHGGGMGYCWITPYYRSAPWLHMLVRSGIRWAADVQTDADLSDLPLPTLNRDGTGRYLHHFNLWHEYFTACRDLAQRRESRREQAIWHKAYMWVAATSEEAALAAIERAAEDQDWIADRERDRNGTWTALELESPTRHIVRFVNALAAWPTDAERLRQRVIEALSGHEPQAAWIIHYEKAGESLVRRVAQELARTMFMHIEYQEDDES